MYGALVIIWIVVPAYITTLGVLSTDVVNGNCVPWGVYGTYAAGKTASSLNLFITYLLPLTMMVSCYSRIVYVLKRKVVQHVVAHSYNDFIRLYTPLLGRRRTSTIQKPKIRPLTRQNPSVKNDKNWQTPYHHILQWTSYIFISRLSRIMEHWTSTKINTKIGCDICSMGKLYLTLCEMLRFCLSLSR